MKNHFENYNVQLKPYRIERSGKCAPNRSTWYVQEIMKATRLILWSAASLTPDIKGAKNPVSNLIIVLHNLANQNCNQTPIFLIYDIDSLSGDAREISYTWPKRHFSSSACEMRGKKECSRRHKIVPAVFLLERSLQIKYVTEVYRHLNADVQSPSNFEILSFRGREIFRKRHWHRRRHVSAVSLMGSHGLTFESKAEKLELDHRFRGPVYRGVALKRRKESISLPSWQTHTTYVKFSLTDYEGIE